MTVRKYTPEDFAQIQAWGAEYGDTYEPDQLPATGFIVDGVAAYFLYKTDTTCCWLENLIATRKTDYWVKDEAIRLLIDACVAEAKALGFKVAYASTDRYTVALRGKKIGAHVAPNHMLLSLNLNET